MSGAAVPSRGGVKGWSQPAVVPFTCPTCGQADVFNRFLHRCHTFAEPTMTRSQPPRNRNPRRPAGERCRWPHCQVTRDDGVAFETSTECGACAHQRRKPGGACGRCGGPRARWGCPSCSRPTNLVAVILLDESSDRERTIYRAVLDGRRVTVRGIHYPIRRLGDPVVITLPTRQWAGVRL